MITLGSHLYKSHKPVRAFGGDEIYEIIWRSQIEFVYLSINSKKPKIISYERYKFKISKNGGYQV